MLRSPCVLLLLAGALAAGCGKKGPPLPPLIRIPQAVGQIDAHRLGRDVYVALTVPSQNVDASSPADVSRVDLFAVTAAAPPAPGTFLRVASRIATIRVTAPPQPEEGQPTPAAPADAAAQGAVVIVRETLTADQLVVRPSAPAPPAANAPSAIGVPAGQSAVGPRRFYMAYAFSDRARSSTAGAMAAVPIGTLPPPPADVTLVYTEEAMVLSWGASAGATGYNIYRDDAPAPAPLPEGDRRGAVQSARRVPANPEPVTALTFSEALQFGREHCYEVRAIGEIDAARVESERSEQRCVTPLDTFRPAPPTELSAVSREDGAIDLRWNANAEPDAAGYLVLRGQAGDATLLQITGMPIAQTGYTDRDVMPGVRYVYAVVAVDGAVPAPNRSAESLRDEVTAR